MTLKYFVTLYFAIYMIEGITSRRIKRENDKILSTEKVEKVVAQKLPNLSQVPTVLQFGEIPSNRVLPVGDSLSDSDYQDVAELEIPVKYPENDNREYCTELLRSDLTMILKRLRKSRQDENEEDEESNGLLSGYLDFNPARVVPPLRKILISAVAANASAVDENYKKLPPTVKSQVTDFINVFNELLETIRSE